MFLRNPFTPKQRELFFYKIECDWCGQNSWDAIHHIMGRTSSSSYNMSSIHNIRCHIGNSKLDSFDSRAMLLKKTKEYLDSEGYVPNSVDLEFLKKHARLYNS